MQHESDNFDLIPCELEGVLDTPDEIEKGRGRIRALLWRDGPKAKFPLEESPLWEVASRPYAWRSRFFTVKGDGSSFSGVQYRFGDADYAISEGDVYFENEDREYEFVLDAEIRKGVLALEKKDQEISEGRHQLAKLYSEGDPILEEAIRMHLEYSDGRIQPFYFEGIPFFKVGRNASHEFYAGTQEGKRIVLCYCSSFGLDDQGNETQQIEHSLHESEEGWGYIGHF